MDYKKMKIAVGLFISLLFLTIGVGIYTLAIKKGMFEKSYKYTFHTTSASAFSVGMPLMMSGFSVGSIDDIKLNNDGTVTTTFSLNKKNRIWMTQGTTLLLKRPLIGAPHIEIHPIIGNKELPENSTLPILISDDINDMITRLEPVTHKAINIIDSIDTITAKIAKDDSNLAKSMQNLERFTNTLASSDSLLTSVTGDKASTKALIASLHESKKLTEELTKSAKELNALIKAADPRLIAPASASLKELELITKDVNNKLKTLDATIKAIGDSDKEVLLLKEQVIYGIQKSNEIMQNVENLLPAEKKEEIKLP